MSPFIPSGRFTRHFSVASTLLLLLLLSGFSLSAQQPTCSVSATVPTVHAEGYTEPIGTYTFTCSGGTPGANVAISLFVAAGVNITNRLDSGGNPTGITVTASPGVFVGGLTMYSAQAIEFSQVGYTVPTPSSTAITISISGILAAVATLGNATTGIPVLNGMALAIGAQFTAPPSLPVALLAPTLLSSNINNGIPCGSPLPPTIDFPTFLATGTSASSIRITEASATAFMPKAAGNNTGLRILVNLSGYPAGASVFVPDAIVGADAGAVATSTGLFGATANPGYYTPGNNELLLVRVNGADATGTGGYFAISVPLVSTTFSTVSQLTLSGGSTYAVYEVVDSNPGIVETAQIPVWVATPSSPCTGAPVSATFSPMIAPVSTVSIATQTDPIPRYMATTPASDCKVIGDCSANYLPTLSVDTTPLVFGAPSLGSSQITTLAVSNSGSGILNYTVTVAYQSAPSGWLTVTPASGTNFTTLTVTASPAMLDPGTYTATITINAGTQSAQIPVTFNVGPVGITIQNVGNAASFQYGTVAPGSYAVIFGVNLLGVSTTNVTFNGVPATIVYKSATQINAIVPTALTNTRATVVVTADGVPSNNFNVTLANFPGIFTPGIINFDDGKVNASSAPVVRGKFVTVYLTGLILPLTGPVTVNIGSQTNLIPSFAGAQGTFPALEQVNIVVPASLPAMPNSVPMTVCLAGAPQVCSNAVNLYIQ